MRSLNDTLLGGAYFSRRLVHKYPLGKKCYLDLPWPLGKATPPGTNMTLVLGVGPKLQKLQT